MGRTTVLMGLSAAFMAILGMAASFFPQEILTYAGSSTDSFAVLVVQIAGALYLGFAMLNWMARTNLIGGIYSRPVALGNFLHFFVVTLALWKTIARQQAPWLIVGAVVYTLFALLFGLVLFTHPKAPEKI